MALTVERLKEVISYEPETGVFVWLVRTSKRMQIGDVAGHICQKSGYRLIGVDGRLYKANRLAWLYMTGEWPSGHVDHINMVVANDKWANLRIATHAQNLQNRGKQKNNTSGFKGVFFHPQSGRWRARINANKQSVSLGLHDTPELAHMAYREAASALHGEFANV